MACLDWLRFLVVLSLTPFHAALSFTGMGTVYVYDKQVLPAILAGHFVYDMGPWPMRWLIIFLDNFFMHLLFFISGIGAAMALRKRSGGQFLAERVNRLLLPTGVCTLTIVAAQVWLRELSFGRFSGSFLAFYPHFFNGPHTSLNGTGNFEWSHLWFLVYLFTFSLIMLPWFLHVQRQGPASRLAMGLKRTAAGGWILLFALWVGLLEAVFRPGWPGFQNLTNDWANFTVYLSLFVFGYLAGREPGLLQAAQRLCLPALALGLGLFLLRMGIYSWIAVPPGYAAANMAVQGVRGMAAFCLVIGIVGLARRYLNRSGWALAWARDLSFPLYLLHFLPLTAFTMLLLRTDWSIWTRWTLAVLASWICVALFTLCARFIPPLRWFFGIRPRPRPHPA